MLPWDGDPLIDAGYVAGVSEAAAKAQTSATQDQGVERTATRRCHGGAAVGVGCRSVRGWRGGAVVAARGGRVRGGSGRVGPGGVRTRGELGPARGPGVWLRVG